RGGWRVGVGVVREVGVVGGGAGVGGLVLAGGSGDHVRTYVVSGGDDDAVRIGGGVQEPGGVVAVAGGVAEPVGAGDEPVAVGHVVPVGERGPARVGDGHRLYGGQAAGVRRRGVLGLHRRARQLGAVERHVGQGAGQVAVRRRRQALPGGAPAGADVHVGLRGRGQGGSGAAALLGAVEVEG